MIIKHVERGEDGCIGMRLLPRGSLFICLIVNPSTAQTSRYTVLPIDHDPPLARPRWHDFEKKYVGIKI